jgi:hypothetical protein
MTLAYDVRRPITIAGFPLSAWAFALRIWAAMLVGLYAAFWRQLESASSAAITVGILALQTRAQVYQKAAYRVLATIIGVVASFVVAGLFPQTRELFMMGFAGWLGLCVYVGGLLTCPFRKPYPNILMMQSGQDWDGDNDTGPLDCSMQGRIFL